MNDYAQIRKHKEHSEAVSVNHRALITRTLTKYPVDYALFRELLQNSADAKADTATIHFHSEDSASYGADISRIHSVPITKLVFSNDGADFMKEDWDRLKEIAKGNPNETKIGAFGVGFYSVFELTDEPLVHSGSRIISFHYEGDQLQYNWADAKTPVKGAVVDLPYRTKGVLPDLVKFTAFLVQSFVLVPLNRVVLKVDDTVLLDLSKQSSSPFPQSFPQALNAKSPNGTLRMASMSMTPLQITIEYLNATQMPPVSLSSGFFNIGKSLVKSLLTKSDNPLDRTKLVCFLRRTDALVDVKVSSSFRRKMTETVMKAPPSQSTMSLLSYSKQEMDNSDIKPPLSEYIFPAEFNDAKIFIGFPTKQSTSFKSHLALNQIVPTMERTAVDMSNAFVKDWNSELLYMAGVMARCVYENELKSLANSDLSLQLEAAKYTMQRFQFGTSAPDQTVGACIASGFWKCSNVMLLPTSMGILPSTQVRLAGSKKPLLRKIPSIESDETNKIFVDYLVAASYIKPVTTEEVIADLKREPISQSLLVAAATWLEANKHSLSAAEFRDFKAAMKVKLADGRVQDLGDARYYQDAYIVGEGMPVPPTCLSADVVELLGKARLIALGIQRLPLAVWTSYITQDAARLRKHAEELLATLDRSWHTVREGDQTKIANTLAECACVPTNEGLKIPSETYVAKISLFPALPVVSDSVRASKAFLLTIGVRESVDMAFVLEALHNPSSGFKWTTTDLADYLVDNSVSLKQDDWLMLRQGAFYRNSRTNRLEQISTLYAPAPEIVKLGFPVIEWSRSWVADSPAGQLLRRLGIRFNPPVLDLFKQALEKNLLPTAVKYYLRNYKDTTDYALLRQADLPIVPSNRTYSRPSECFVDSEVQQFGFAVIADEYAPYAAMFRVAQRPPVSALVDYLLAHPPRTMVEGDPMFAYLSNRVGEISRIDVEKCDRAFIPVDPSKKLFASPTEVFMKSSDAGDIKELFHFVEPLPASVPFLLKVGVRQSPSLVEIAQQTVSDPNKVFTLIGDVDKYTALLAKFHYGWSELSRDKSLVRSMERSPFLLAFRHEKALIEDMETSTAVLAPAADLNIVDDVMIFNRFKDEILTAPQESAIEQFYAKLGVTTLSGSIKESCQLGGPTDYKDRLKVQERIHERLRLFLESTSKPCRIKPSEAGTITVEFVTRIQIRQQLRNTRAIESELTALIHPSHPKKLLLTPNFDWFHVSQALTKAVSLKPDPESVIVLELQLSTDLRTLQNKGYNVDRLLNKKKKVELSVPAIEPAKQAPPQAPAIPQAPSKPEPQASNYTQPPQAPPEPRKVAQSPSRTPARPAAPAPSPPRTAKSGSLLKSLFGRDKHSAGAPAGAAGASGGRQNGGPGGTSGPDGVGAASINKNVLKNAIDSCQPYNSAHMNGRDHVDAPDPVNTCKDSGTRDLHLQARLEDGVPIFVKNGTSGPSQEQLRYAREFSEILKRCSAIYECRFDSFCMYTSETKSIAFNYNGSLFFNLEVFISQARGASWQPAVTLDYWYTVMAHELAHNLVMSHGAEHSSVTENYIQTYLARLRGQRLPETASGICK